MTRNWLTATLSTLCIGLAIALAVVSTRANNKMDSTSGQAANHSHDKHLWHCGMDQQVIQDHPGDCPICHMALTPLDSGSTESTSTEKKVLYWWDPMLGPSSITNHPGKSAMGMELVPVYAEQAGPAVTIDPVLQQNMGVRTAAVTRGPLIKTVRAVGWLKIPEPAIHDINLKVTGWIDKLYADHDGAHVAAGEPLFDLYSPDLQVAEQELIAAVKSNQSLAADASKDLRRESESMIESSKRKLRLWDIAEQDIETIAKADQPPRSVPFRSPATGHLEDKIIVQGSAVAAGMRIMRVAGHTRMWLDAQVYEGELPLIKMGQEIVATIDGIPGRIFKGKITFMNPHVDHMTRTLTVRITIDNTDFELRPGMYASAEIMTQPLADAILAPREAVIDTGTRQIAFVDTGNGHFDSRKVRMGITGDDDRVQILEGLAPGEIVVTSGQFLMDVESHTIEATQKLTQAQATTMP